MGGRRRIQVGLQNKWRDGGTHTRTLKWRGDNYVGLTTFGLEKNATVHCCGGWRIGRKERRRTHWKVGLIDWMVFYAAFNSISVISRQQLTLFVLSWVSPVLGWALKCLVQGHSHEKTQRIQCGSNPGPLDYESNTLPLSRMGPLEVRRMTEVVLQDDWGRTGKEELHRIEEKDWEGGEVAQDWGEGLGRRRSCTGLRRRTGKEKLHRIEEWDGRGRKAMMWSDVDWGRCERGRRR